MDHWNPDQYNQFKDERSQPFWDLAAKIDFSKAESLLDIGCGTGELTAALHAKAGLKKTLGIDSSQGMLDRSSATRLTGLQFSKGDVQNFSPNEAFDVVFSNAALQWVEGHKELFRKIMNWLKPGGTLAVQMPVNFDHASHVLASDVAQEMKLKVRFPPVLAPETYAELLWRAGYQNIDVIVKVYLHPMKSGLNVVEWTKGTLLTHYEKQTTPENFQKFLSEYTKRLRMVIGDGPYVYPFKRLFVVARSPGKN